MYRTHSRDDGIPTSLFFMFIILYRIYIISFYILCEYFFCEYNGLARLLRDRARYGDLSGKYKKNYDDRIFRKQYLDHNLLTLCTLYSYD